MNLCVPLQVSSLHVCALFQGWNCQPSHLYLRRSHWGFHFESAIRRLGGVENPVKSKLANSGDIRCQHCVMKMLRASTATTSVPEQLPGVFRYSFQYASVRLTLVQQSHCNWAKTRAQTLMDGMWCAQKTNYSPTQRKRWHITVYATRRHSPVGYGTKYRAV